MLFASSASNDCECTNTLAHKSSESSAGPKFVRTDAYGK